MGAVDGRQTTCCSVLIADDDRTLCESLRDVLEVEGYRVDTVPTGRDALAYCTADPPDVLLLDVNLPDSSGLDLIARVEQIQPAIEILIITGLPALDHVGKAVSRSTIGYLIKPLDLDCLLGILGGIAERKRVAIENQRLSEIVQEGKRQWEGTFDAISDPIVIVDPAGNLLRCNQAFCQRFETTYGSAVGAPAAELIFGSDSEAERFLTPRGRGVEEWSDLVVPGVFQVSRDPLKIGQGQGAIFVLRDVTESRQAAAEREGLIRQLGELVQQLADKNAEMEHYTYTVSHDLKSPLVTITGFVRLLEGDAESGNAERLRDDVARIENAALKMAELLDGLLDLSRIGRMVNPPEDVSVAELARTALDSVSLPAAVRGLDARVADDLPVVRGDRARLLQAVQHLVDNAIKFSDGQPEPRLEIGARERGGEVACYVRDYGIGIEPRFHDQIFGLFNQLDQDAAGKGIGLPLVKKIVEVHGGRVWVESEGLGKGTAVYFTLPVAQGSVRPSGPELPQPLRPGSLRARRPTHGVPVRSPSAEASPEPDLRCG